MDYYDRQLNRIEQNDSLKEFDGLLEEYINSGDDLSNTLKELIISKANNELSQRELIAFRDNLVNKAKKEEGIKKLRLYELTAGLYNIENKSGNERIGDIETNETPVFEISGGYIERNYRAISIGGGGTRRRNDRFEIIGSNIRHLGDNLYEITLEGRSSNRRSHEEKVLIRYRGGNTVELFDPKRPSRSIGIIPIKNKSRTVERGKISIHGKYSRIIEEENNFIDFKINDNFGTNIHLEIVFNDR